MSRTQVPEEDQRVPSITELKNYEPRPKAVVRTEGESSSGDGLGNLYWWDPSGEATNADGTTRVESSVSGYGDGGSNEGLWRRMFLPFDSATTDDLSEGSTNDYYTDTRARSALSAGRGVNYDQSSGKVSSALNGQYELSSTFEVSESTYNASSTPESLTYNGDGSKAFSVYGNTLLEYNLSTNYDITTASAGTSNLINLDNDFQGLFFNSDGTKLFLAGSENEAIYEYTLSTPYDITTTSYTNNSLDTSGEVGNLHGAGSNADGTKFYVLALSEGAIYTYDLSTGFDVTTASYSGSKFSSFGLSSTRDLAIGGEGKRFYVTESGSGKIIEFVTTMPYDVTQLAENYVVDSLAGTPAGMGVADGTKLHYGDRTNTQIVQRDFEYGVYDLENLEGQLASLRKNTRIRLSTDKTNLEKSSMIRMQAETDTSKPAIGWWDQTGSRIAAIVGHEKLNDSRTHEHWSIETADSGGALQTRLEFPYGSDEIMIETQSASFKVSAGQDFNVGTSGGAETNANFYGNVFQRGTGDVGFGDKDWHTEGLEGSGTKFEFFRGSSTSSLLIHQADGTSDAVLYLRKGTKDWRMINKDPDLIFEAEGTERGRITENGKFSVSDSYIRRISDVSSNQKTSGHDFYSVDSSSSSVTITLSSADAEDGRVIHVKRNGSNTVTVDTEGSETIDGSSSADITADKNAVKLVYNSSGSNWEIY